MSRPRPRLAAATLPAALAATAGLASCNILGPATYFAFGQPSVPAQYELPDVPTVVFVDDRNNAIPLNATRIRRTIADKVSMDLMEEDVLTETVSVRDAMVLARNRDREGNLLSVEALGEAAGARQVIYVEMLGFRGTPDGYTPTPTAACRVKVIDVVGKVRLFPPPGGDDEWREVIVQSPPISPDLYRTAKGRRTIEDVLAQLLGRDVGRLFYKHVPEELGERLNPR